MFVDELEFRVAGGRGGDGCVSFHREKFVTRGGPNGGDGGRGGDVVLQASPHENTLFHLAGRPLYGARNGQPGGTSDMTGASADDLVLDVPLGTQVFDADRGNLLRDLTDAGESFVVARGGRGGRGNARFATATNRTPREAESGRPGEERRVRLSLKLIADVGLVGLPNAGKSTLLATLSRARPRIAAYPFTTLEPHLGIVPFPDGGSIVMADIPGLIEGAAEGRGLGHQFLKHVERTRALLQLVDCSALADTDPLEAWRIVLAELRGYSDELARRPRLVVATKVEDDDSRAAAARLRAETGEVVVELSAVTRGGLEQLLGYLRRLR
ncbi:MAG: GTPase ObgE [Planctomycetes bacterium]|nr:GTPase ObgE [Planctomycetota bacterium]